MTGVDVASYLNKDDTVSQVIVSRPFDLDIIEIRQATIWVFLLNGILSFKPPPWHIDFTQVLLHERSLGQSPWTSTDHALTLIIQILGLRWLRIELWGGLWSCLCDLPGLWDQSCLAVWVSILSIPDTTWTATSAWPLLEWCDFQSLLPGFGPDPWQQTCS